MLRSILPWPWLRLACLCLYLLMCLLGPAGYLDVVVLASGVPAMHDLCLLSLLLNLQTLIRYPVVRDDFCPLVPRAVSAQNRAKRMHVNRRRVLARTGHVPASLFVDPIVVFPKDYADVLKGSFPHCVPFAMLFGLYSF
ncbi:hypothetical protein EJB05_45391 [Eragrostis curvula]|uniref:Uncharacterized protein n=1 Tax=Eragrostis curvula TaxID=38414 RepID=A0A5J9TLH8_9POAL|nr:hypothetical protein EJB05_45391 [Eragrostis curvula]